ncbi:hypothetical protein [Salipiger mucosus]|uniref:Uncharacterized protein n=1 Tax=Salipiger mucosus DSM 16094 TaxID=1123237 RepID=S9S2V6_9RHOB|nr:hypothetical protein [Salipiger mucosus]EPX80499.1 hypothetical protein Salmuc_03816 [Salipiger mucosus DSM 16094]
MHEAQKDTQRALQAAKAICDGRHPMFERSGVLITLDHVIATVLISAMGNDPKKALAMFNEGTIPSVEERIMLFANKLS